MYFISGLPRSGSTLLSAILNQNPEFTAGISDPLAGCCDAIIKAIDASAGAGSLISEDKRVAMLRALFSSYYESTKWFNTSRSWTSRTSLLKQLFPEFKIIVCVREIPWILDSFEQLDRKNPFTVKPLYHHTQLNSVYDRSAMLMGELNVTGYVIEPLKSLQQSLFCEEIDQILFVEYEALAKDPEKTMRKIYEFLEEDYFEHNFSDVEVSYDEFDEQAKIQGLHTTRKEVKYISRNSILPSDLWAKYEGYSFWKDKNFNTSNLNWIKYMPPTLQYFNT